MSDVRDIAIFAGFLFGLLTLSLGVVYHYIGFGVVFSLIATGGAMVALALTAAAHAGGDE